MTLAKFKNIESFIHVKDTCVFCGTALKPALTNFSNTPYQIPRLNSLIKSGQFNFNIKHTTESFEIEADATLDIATNVLSFKLQKNSEPFDDAIDYMVAKSVFDDLKPHIEIYCANRLCKMDYYINSEILHAVPYDVSGFFVVKPIELRSESFVVDNYWILNDFNTRSSYIYSISNSDSKPIKTKFIDLGDCQTDKVVNRIRNIVTFS